MSVWIQFGACVAVIAVAGVYLTRYGDSIADKTGMGGSWVGLVMIATVTSLPELVSGISAVTVANVPEVAVGDVFGSCLFNLLILALADVFKRGEPLYATVGGEHVLSAGLSILLLGVAGTGLVLAQLGIGTAIGHLGAMTALVIVLYLVSIGVIHRYQRAHVAEFTNEEPDSMPHLSLRQVVVRYCAAAVVVVAAGVWLPFATAALANAMDWHLGFAGTLFTAFATSLPELVVTVSALKLGAVDLAVGNLFGSNLFNIVVLGLDDLFYKPGPLLAAVSEIHLVSVLMALTMSGIALVALYYRSRHRWLVRGDWPSLLLAVMYFSNVGVLFVASAPAR